MGREQLTDVVRQIRKAVGVRADERSDAELLYAFRTRRDEEAFAAIVARYGGLVLGACRRVLGDVHDAEDARQATFLVLARQAGRVRRAETLPGWLYGTAYRISLQARRAAGRRRSREGRVSREEPADPVAELMWRELQTILDEEVRRLPAGERGAFLLCCLEGVPHAEAGKRLGVAEGSVSSRVSRARQRLHRRLSKRGIELSTVLAALAVSSVARAVTPLTVQDALVKACMACAAGRLAALPGLSENAVTLAAGASRTMWTSHTKLALFALVAAGVLGGAARLGAGRPQAAAPAVAAEGSSGKEMKGPTPRDARAGKDRQPSQPVKIAGRILGPDGKPVPGAKLFVPRLKTVEPTSPKDIDVEAAGAADADGKFAVTIRPPGPRMRPYVIAHADGFGVDWYEFGEGRPPAELTLRLPRDVPIRGRVVNTEGKPVAGVSVTAGSIYVPADENLDAYLAGWLRSLRDTLATPKKRLYIPLSEITGAATTDRDGRFTLRGAGAERIVHVQFSGGGVAQSTPYVITREGFDPKPYNDELRKKEHDDLRVLNRFLGLLGPELTFVAEPGQTVEGVVTDAATGKPVPGCSVFAHTGFGDGVVVVTDSAGKYRIDGLAKNARGNGISVQPPKGTAYLGRQALAADAPGYAPQRLDVRLVKGAVVSGRVVDRQTGKGVQAGIRFAPLPDNKFFGAKPGFDNYRSDRTMETTDARGRFRLRTIPGKALVMAQVHAREKVDGVELCPYRMAVPDPDHKDLFHSETDDPNSWLVTTAGGGLEFLSSENAVKVVEIKEGEETAVELFVDRGVTGRLVVQDADGKPLAGAWVSGLTEHWPIAYRMAGSAGTVVALDPKRPRSLVIFHPERRLGGTATVRGDEKGPVVAKLGPLGKVSGRMVEEDGAPLAGAEISVNAQGSAASELYRFANPSGKLPVTDSQGRFTLTGVVPGMPFYLQIHKGEHYYGGKPKIGQRNLKPGESLELGDRTVEVLR
jgi:RNA polymerase sigma factor (sigma-70 family)